MTRASETSMSNEQRRATAFKPSVRSIETGEPSRNYARVPGYKEKYKKKTRKRREKKRKMNGVEINTRAYVATRLLLRWDYLYAVTLKTKVFGDYNHARLEVSWISSTRGLLLRGYTGRRRNRDRAKHVRWGRREIRCNLFGALYSKLLVLACFTYVYP